MGTGSLASRTEKPCSPYLLKPLRSLEEARRERAAQHPDAAAAQSAALSQQAEDRYRQMVIERHARKRRTTWRATS